MRRACVASTTSSMADRAGTNGAGKGREDRPALRSGRQKAAEMAEDLHAEVADELVLRGYEADIARLQAKRPKPAPARTPRFAVREALTAPAP
jgi:hypothetical protein